MVTPELTALLVAIAMGVTRELLRAQERRERRRGHLRTRRGDDPGSPGERSEC